MTQPPPESDSTIRPIEYEIDYLIETMNNIQDALSAMTEELKRLRESGVKTLEVDVPRQIDTGNIGRSPYFFPGLCDKLPDRVYAPGDFFPGQCDENEGQPDFSRPPLFPGLCDERSEEVPLIDVMCRDLWKLVSWLKLICWRLVHR